MSKTRNILFCIFLLAFLCGPSLMYAIEKLGVSAPEFLKSEEARYLVGSTSKTNVSATFSSDEIISGKFQEACEAKIKTYIPARGTAVLLNASNQRACIALSNLFFSWDCYPTYFGSNKIFLPEYNAVTYFPRKQQAEYQKEWIDFAEGVKSAALKYPEKNFVIYVVGTYGAEAQNPGYKLVSSAIQPIDCITTVDSVISECPNVYLLSRTFQNEESFFEDFFRTDHHWNIDGAFSAYIQIASALDLPTVQENGTWDIPDYKFTGSTARTGLDLISESVFDCKNDFSFLTISCADGTTLQGNNHDSFWKESELGKKYSFYDKYYDSLGDCKITGGHGDKAALLVGNSLKGALQRPLASSYRQLTVNNQLHPSAKLTTTLSEQIEDSEAQDIIFVANPGNLHISSQYWE